MLTITVPGVEHFDSEKQEFITRGEVVLVLEHSLVSLSKWEETFQKPFLSAETKTDEEVVGYIKCMITSEFPPEEVFSRLSDQNFEAVNGLITDKRTATWFHEEPGSGSPSRETITAELIYYWMTIYNIPFDREYWHLNKLLTLIRVCNVKQQKPKKMSPQDAAAKRRAMNEKRKAELNTTG